MAQLGLTTAEIGQAVKDQNNQYSFGSVGAMPSSDEIQMTWQVSGLGRLTTPEEFGNIILRTTPDGGVLRLKDVARVELGAKDYSAQGRTDGKLAVPIAVYLGTGANALDTAQRVEAYFEEVSKAFPTGIEYSIPYNTTTFVKISIEEVTILWWKPCSWCSWWCISSFRNGRPRSFPALPYPFPWWAPLRASTRWAFPSTP